MFDKHHDVTKDTEAKHSRKELKSISIQEWADKNDVDLSPVKPVFDMIVASANDLCAAIDHYHTSHFTAPPASAVDPKVAEAKAIEEGRHVEYLRSVTEPGSGANAAQEFSAIEQASRNLRTQIQAFATK